jgi:sugar/nucleoside kinase (ribokinase family)
VDPTGCGDVFGAAWEALRVGHDQDPEAAVRGAVLASGAAATVSGTARLAEVLAATMDAILHPEAIR